MGQKTTDLLFLVLLFGALRAAAASGPSKATDAGPPVITADGRQPGDISLNGEWDFTYTPPSAREMPDLPPTSAFDAKIQVPGRWDEQLDRFHTAAWWPDARFVFANVGWNARYLSGIGWHQTGFHAPSTWRNCPVTLTVGWAPGAICYVWLNRSFVGQYEYGFYTPCSFDLTPHLKLGTTNELIIALDNTRGLAGFYRYAGLHGRASGLARPVTLHVSEGPGRITDLFVQPGEDLSEVVWQAQLEVPSKQLAPASRLLWEVCDASDQVLDRGEVDVPQFTGQHQANWKKKISAVRPWSDRHPNLYRTRIRWQVGNQPWDRREQRFGLRRWSRDGRKLFLNGEPIYLRGETSLQMLNPLLNTLPASKEFWLTQLQQVKDLGFNLHVHCDKVTWVPLPPELLEAADEVGIIVQAGDQLTSSVPSYRGRYNEVWKPYVLWTRGYPSMCIYGFGSEDDYYEGVLDQFQKQYDLVKFLHPESLVMPQQAARGVEYHFERELTVEEREERLEQYTKASDIFGSYLDGTFGYDFFNPDLPWQRSDKAWSRYQRPTVVHELYMRSSYPNPDNASKYTGLLEPFMYTELRDQLALTGLSSKWRTYWEHSGRLNAIARKFCIEKARKCANLCGYELLGFDDGAAYSAGYLSGMLDEFHQFKPGDDAAGILRYSNESVLLLEFEDGDGGLNRSYWAMSKLPVDIMLSLYGPRAIPEARLEWVLKESGSGTEVLKGEQVVREIRNGRVSILHSMNIEWPEVQQTTKLNFAVRLKGAGYQLANDWDFWVFPNNAPPEITAAADKECQQKLKTRYPTVFLRTAESGAHLHIVSEITAQDVEHLLRGGDILLLGTRPFPTHKNAGNPSPGIYPAMATRQGQAVGAVIHTRHPILKDLPDEGWGDWIFMPLLARAPRIFFDKSKNSALDIRPFDPIVEMISEPGRVDKVATIFEAQVGTGRLLVSTCPAEMDNPSKVALMDGLLRYACGDAFRPQMELAPEVLTALIEAQNHPPAPVATGYSAMRDRATYKVEWHNEAVTIEFGAKLFYQVNDGAWQEGFGLQIDRTGITQFVTKPSVNALPERPREVGIDLTLPSIVLLTTPELAQEGSGLYAVPDTVFAIEAKDDLSGVKSVEVKIDDAEYAPYEAPFRLKPGTHSIECRVTDRAGNLQEIMKGKEAHMSPTTKAIIVVRPLK